MQRPGSAFLRDPSSGQPACHQTSGDTCASQRRRPAPSVGTVPGNRAGAGPSRQRASGKAQGRAGGRAAPRAGAPTVLPLLVPSAAAPPAAPRGPVPVVSASGRHTAAIHAEQPEGGDTGGPLASSSRGAGPRARKTRCCDAVGRQLPRPTAQSGSAASDTDCSPATSLLASVGSSGFPAALASTGVVSEQLRAATGRKGGARPFAWGEQSSA